MAVQNLAAKKEVTEQVKVIYDVHRSGDKIFIPEDCTLQYAIEMLKSRIDHESQKVTIKRTIQCMPQEGAIALYAVLTEKYGFAAQGWGEQIEIEVGYKKRTSMFWGTYPVKEMEAMIATGWDMNKGRIQFQLVGVGPRFQQPKLDAIFNEVERMVAAKSLYRGQSLEINFYDFAKREWLAMPEITFMNPAGVLPENAIYSREVEGLLETNLYTPIARAQDCLANDISVKRGVLLAGTYGTGKTLAAGVAQRLAYENGITYVYIKHAFQLAKAVIFARMYQSPSAVVFCEDIDRFMKERSEGANEILNTIDGIDGKRDNITIVLTTNEVNDITPAMLRPGRLDAVIEVTAPDAEAISRLIRLYAAEKLEAWEDISEASELLSGKVAAVVAEVVRRAKLAQLTREKPGSRIVRISGAALAIAARSIVGQTELLDRLEAARQPKEESDLEEALADVVEKALADRFD